MASREIHQISFLNVKCALYFSVTQLMKQNNYITKFMEHQSLACFKELYALLVSFFK